MYLISLKKYEVVKTTSRNKDDLDYFYKHDFVHPSYQKTNNTYSQGVQKRPLRFLAKINQYDFPDTATFDGDMTLTETKTTQDTETYSKNVLLLFIPFRRDFDLTYLGSYTLKLRIVYDSNRLKKICFFTKYTRHKV